ncbi:hypothetical protein [Ottowia sp.]|nr:hypothetical protein [Ottowia sp.]HPZ57288.1 hypothetical protein [Ottowia sp.]HQD47206.1 hypothetical protein [Ottowia sp.]
MPYFIEASDSAAFTERAWSDLHAQAVALSHALSDCCHPRAARLQARLSAHIDPDQLAQLRGEVLNVLALSFGAAEAQRRLHCAAPQKLQ